MSDGWNQRDGKEDRPRTRSGEFKPRLSIPPAGSGITDWTAWDRAQGIEPETPAERAARLAAQAAGPPPEARRARSLGEPKAPRASAGEARATQPGRGHNRYSGKPLWCTKAVNPRKPGSHGFRSLAIIIEQPGIIYEAYIKAGGRLNDLTWDDEHGNVKFTAD
jgi:hypothetical protein